MPKAAAILTFSWVSPSMHCTAEMIVSSRLGRPFLFFLAIIFSESFGWEAEYLHWMPILVAVMTAKHRIFGWRAAMFKNTSSTLILVNPGDNCHFSCHVSTVQQKKIYWEKQIKGKNRKHIARLNLIYKDDNSSECKLFPPHRKNHDYLLWKLQTMSL